MEGILHPVRLKGIGPQDFIDVSPNREQTNPDQRIYYARDIPTHCRLEWLVQYAGLDERTIFTYRQIAREHVAIYKQSMEKRNPHYLKRKLQNLQKKAAGKKTREVAPDPPPFPYVEARIILAIAVLFSKLNHRIFVIDHIKARPTFFLEQVPDAPGVHNYATDDND